MMNELQADVRCCYCIQPNPPTNTNTTSRTSITLALVPVTFTATSALSFPLFHLLLGSLENSTPVSQSSEGVVKMNNGETVQISHGICAMGEETGHQSSLRCDESSPSSLQVKTLCCWTDRALGYCPGGTLGYCPGWTLRFPIVSSVGQIANATATLQVQLHIMCPRMEVMRRNLVTISYMNNRPRLRSHRGRGSFSATKPLLMVALFRCRAPLVSLSSLGCTPIVKHILLYMGCCCLFFGGTFWAHQIILEHTHP